MIDVAVRGTGLKVQDHRHAGAFEGCDERLPGWPERVLLADDDERRRETSAVTQSGKRARIRERRL